MEIRTGEIVKKETDELRLETLGRGIRQINKGNTLPKAIEFLSKFNNLNINVETDLNEKAMEIVFPTRMLSEEYKDWNSTAFIVDEILSDKIVSRGKGTRQLIIPSEYYAAIRLNEDLINELDLVQADEIELHTRFTKNKIMFMLANINGKIPENWKFNPR